MQLQATIAGRLSRDPELNYTPNGEPICKLSLPSEIYLGQDKEGNHKRDTQWVTITVFKDKAESVAKYCAKGTSVLVIGPIKFREYTTRDGRHGVSLEMIADKIEYIANFGAEYVAKSKTPIDDFAPVSVDKFTGEVLEEHPF